MMITPLEAAKLIAADYEGRLDADARLDIDGCQAAVVSRGHRADLPVLLIRGTDERQDWLINFDARKRAAPGDTVLWHKGFLERSQIVYAFAKGRELSAVIGHSLGGACVQIVATSLGLPGLAFAAPRALYAPGAAPRPANTHLVQIFNRVDDIVCYLPDSVIHILRTMRELRANEDMITPPDGFTWASDSWNWLRPKVRHVGEDHRIQCYLPLLELLA